MNDQKPNTPAQRAVDKILRQDAAQGAQKEIDAAVREMEKGQSKEAATQAANGVEADEAKKASDGREAYESFRRLPDKAKQEGHYKVNPLSEECPTPTSKSETQSEDNDYYNGISQ